VTSRTAAARYARALFDVALTEKAELSNIEAELVAINKLFADHPPLAKVLLNPAVPVPRKRAAMVELTRAGGVSPITSKLLVMLAERDRLILLSDLAAAFRDRVADHQKVVRAEVSSASPLAEGQVDAIKRSLSKASGRSVILTTKIDPAIIGGLVAKVGGTVYDGSIVTQLQKLKQRLVERA